jgi:hypothetical protein
VSNVEDKGFGFAASQLGTDEYMLIPLKAAYERFRREPGGCNNSYDWYRQRAQQDGTVAFGDRRQLVRTDCPDVSVVKVKGRWMVDEEEVIAEIKEHQAARAELDQITRDYKDMILHGGPGTTLRTDFGSYTVYSDFHSIWRSDARPWKETGVYWFCNRCWKPATLVHDKEECHVCSDWGSCGRDCTLSEVSCHGCGTSMPM